MTHPIIISSKGELQHGAKLPSLMQQALIKARNEIMAREDEEIFKILDSLGVDDI